MKNRRKFIQACGVAAMSTTVLSACPMAQTPVNQSDNINEVGPKSGYTPQVGTLVSMLNWMRDTILSPVRGMSVAELDFLLDDNANSIGSMLLHLAATERFYQLHTFDGRSWGDWPDKDNERFSAAMSLGDRGRAEIKGNKLDFYLETLAEVRAVTLKELANRDDKWLLSVDNSWYWGPTNNYCKWFHVVEHESNHNGQIKMVKSRIAL